MIRLKNSTKTTAFWYYFLLMGFLHKIAAARILMMFIFAVQITINEIYNMEEEVYIPSQEEVAQWMRDAEQGDAEAQYNLGVY